MTKWLIPGACIVGLLLIITFLILSPDNLSSERDKLYEICSQGSSFEFESSNGEKIEVVCLRKEEFFINCPTYKGD